MAMYLHCNYNYKHLKTKKMIIMLIISFLTARKVISAKNNASSRSLDSKKKLHIK